MAAGVYCSYRDMLTSTGMLRIEDHVRRGRHTWLMTGRLNRATAVAFEAAVLMLCEQAPISLALDVRDLTAIDSAGMRAIACARELCGGRGCELRLIALSTLTAPGSAAPAAVRLAPRHARAAPSGTLR